MTGSGEPVRRAASATFGKYELFAKLGSGGMAEVFLALSRGMAGFNKLVVLKRLRPSLAEDTSMVSMFLDEARLAARLHHPNIVNTYEVGEQDGSYFIAMEYLEGQPLNRILKNAKAQESFTPAMWCHVFAEALAGLHHAHEQKDFDGKPLDIVHRDLSPHNIFVTYSGETKLVDFGIAKASVNTTSTATGILKGKVNYMSPEQVRGNADRRSDIFAMGLTLWEVLAGKGVFRGEAVTVLHRILNDAIPKLSEARPDIDPALEAIVMKALEKDKELRYQTADEFREALEEYVRAKGEGLRDTAIGKVVSTMFQETKDNVAERIKECVTGLQAAKPVTGESHTAPLLTTGSLPSLTLTPGTGEYPHLTNLSADTSDPGASSGSGSQGVSVKIATESLTASASTRPSGATPFTSSAYPQPKSKLPWVFVALAAFGLIGGIVYVLSSKKPDVAQPAATTAKVALDSTPSGATIEREGQVVGHTPAHLDLPLGKQSLTLRHDGYAAETVTIDVKDGAKESVTLKAESAPAPSGAPPQTAAVGPSTTAKGPGQPAYAAPVKHGGPTPPVTAAPQASTAAAPSATAASGDKGYLSFNTFPWTRVSEGGRVIGTTPLYKVALPPGTHTLSLDNPEENVHSTFTVTIKPGESVSRTLELK